MVENEFKVMLAEEQYNAIKQLYNWDEIVEQTNYYYDTEGLSLSSQHITCRIRSIGDKKYLQMKLPNGKDYSRIEVEEEYSGLLLSHLSGARLSKLCGVEGMPDVKLLGGLTTVRCVKKLDGAEIDLDMSSYFETITDYELEIEFTDEATARAELAIIREKAGIASSGDVCLGKLHRFLAEYKKRR